MKKFLYVTLLALCWACSTTAPQKDKMEHLVSKLSFYKPDRLKLLGDFDGDGTQDTLIEQVYSSLRHRDLDSVPDPLQNDKDSITSWFDMESLEVLLVSPNDTLHLGPSLGLYCLINVGDHNMDRGDEVAVVLDSLDYSKTNVCSIYALCKGQWMVLHQFSIHEDAFEMMNDEGLEKYTHIKGYLERKEERWCYSDYLSARGIDSTSRNVKWQMLKLPACP